MEFIHENGWTERIQSIVYSSIYILCLSIKTSIAQFYLYHNLNGSPQPQLNQHFIHPTFLKQIYKAIKQSPKEHVTHKARLQSLTKEHHHTFSRKRFKYKIHSGKD